MGHWLGQWEIILLRADGSYDPRWWSLLLPSWGGENEVTCARNLRRARHAQDTEPTVRINHSRFYPAQYRNPTPTSLNCQHMLLLIRQWHSASTNSPEFIHLFWSFALHQFTWSHPGISMETYNPMRKVEPREESMLANTNDPIDIH